MTCLILPVNKAALGASVVVNRVQVGDGEEQKTQRWNHHKCQFTATCPFLSRCCLLWRLMGLGYFLIDRQQRSTLVSHRKFPHLLHTAKTCLLHWLCLNLLDELYFSYLKCKRTDLKAVAAWETNMAPPCPLIAALCRLQPIWCRSNCIWVGREKVL